MTTTRRGTVILRLSSGAISAWLVSAVVVVVLFFSLGVRMGKALDRERAGERTVVSAASEPRSAREEALRDPTATTAGRETAAAAGYGAVAEYPSRSGRADPELAAGSVRAGGEATGGSRRGLASDELGERLSSIAERVGGDDGPGLAGPASPARSPAPAPAIGSEVAALRTAPPAPPREDPRRAEPERAAPARAAAPTPPREPARPPVAPKGSYTIQVSSVRSRTDADAFAEKLRGRKWDAFVARADLGDRGIFYRVYVGGYDSRDAADRALAKFKNAEGRSDPYVTKKP